MALAEATDVVLTSESLSISTWPHAVIDCPAAWSSPSPSHSPCSSCFCFVCDLPFSNCDDPSVHAPADGAQEDWRRAKRRRAAILNAWHDIPALVNLIVQLSVDEAARNAAAGRPLVIANGNGECGSPTYVGMTAGYGGGKKEFGVKGEPDVDGIAKGLADVSLEGEGTGVFGGNAEQEGGVSVKQEFVKKELVDHVNNELRSHNLVKSEIVSHVVHPGPE